MMYSEFVAATGCKDSPKNYEVYRHLEILYMNSDVTKEQIYEYGRKLVDNSKSEREIEAEKKTKAEIAALKAGIEQCKEDIARYKKHLETETDEAWKREWKYYIRAKREIIARNTQAIHMLKA